MGTLRLVPYTCAEDRGIQHAVTNRLSHIPVLALPFDRLCMDLYFLLSLITEVLYFGLTQSFDLFINY